MTESAEFTLPQQYPTDRRTPTRWVISHALRQWPIMLAALIGALGNAGLLSVVQINVGKAFNVVVAPLFDLNALASIFLVIALASTGRGLL